MDSTFDNTFDTSATLTEPVNTISFTAAEASVMESVARQLRIKSDELGELAADNPQHEDCQLAHMKAESAYDLVNSLYMKLIRHREFQGQPHHNPSTP